MSCFCLCYPARDVQHGFRRSNRSDVSMDSISKALEQQYTRKLPELSSTVSYDGLRSPSVSYTGKPLVSTREYQGYVKLLMLGDSAVGKSSLLLRFCCANFDPRHVATIG